MISRLSKLVIAAAVVTPLIAGTSPASAAGAATVVGTGTITPGLTLTCTVQTSIKFNGTAAVVDPVVSGVYPIAFSGASAGCETEIKGQGGGTLTGAISGNVTYDRTGTVVTISGNVTVNGHPRHVEAGCVFIPRSVQPTTSYALECDVVVS